MKKILFITIITLLMCGCTTNVGSEINKKESNPKPITKQECDFMGWNSNSIIERNAKEGYIFTGKTTGFWCDNLLNFQLKEEND